MAQPVNLVPNGSFEDTIDFGNGAVEPKLWDLTLGSPNYFSSYYTFPFENTKTPQNYYGFQYPKNGKSYMGLFVKYIPSSEEREYIQIKLKNSLLEDSIYQLSFWINLPDSFHWACEQKNVAFAFSDTMIEYPQHLHKRIDWLSSIFSESIWDATNKIGWEKLIRTFKATGNEEYLIIGNFLDSNETILVDVGGGIKDVYNDNSYYFIDDIKLYKYSEIDTISSPTDTNNTKKLIVPNIFTPNGDGINDIWKVSNPSLVKEIIIYNRWGGIVCSLGDSDFIWKGKNCNEGVYFYKIIMKLAHEESIKIGTITLLR